MRTSNIIGVWLAGSLLLMGTSALGDEMSDAIQPLLKAEATFAADVDTLGIRDGFLKHLSADAIVFNPAPVNGHEYYTQQEALSARLLWTPEIAEMDETGTFGWTSGPWQYFDNPEESVAAAGGHYATVWQKDKMSGEWKALIDIGISHKIVHLTVKHVYPLPGGQADESRNPRPAAYRKAVLNAERSLIKRASHRGFRASLLAILDVDAWVLRDGYLPGTNRGEQTNVLEHEIGTAIWEPTDVRVAPKGDLAFTYGSGTAKWEGKEREFGYLRIWRNVAGVWRVALDVRTWIPTDTEE